MPLEIGDPKRDTIYARATGQPEIERVEFTTAEKPGRLVLDPRLLAHDWNMLDNRERRAVVGGAAWKIRVDDPFRETARRDRLVRAWLPVGWYNDPGGITLGLRERSNYLGSYDRGLLLGSVATRQGASNRAGFYARWGNPARHPLPRTETTVAAWAIEGRAGVALAVDRSLRRHPTFGADPHVGFAALWMATTDVGYLDPRLWDDAGTVEAGPWISTALQHGSAVLRAQLGARGGVVYWNPGAGVVSADRYDVEPFARATGEASLRAPFLLGTSLGLRAFAGGYLGSSNPVKQRRITIAGADPYQTFTNPLLRSRGALFVRPDFHYQAPGGANLRAFRSDLAGRWALALNTELSRAVFRRQQGILREVALEGFCDVGLVDSLAVTPSPNGRWYSQLHDLGAGVVTRQRIGDLAWTMRAEFPLEMNGWHLAPDFHPPGKRIAFRWLVSLEPSF